MRGTKNTGGFVLCLFINLLLNLEWAVPGIILLCLHFWIGLSIWFSIIAFVLWIIGITIWMRIIGWARKCGDTPDPPKENKNPYSVGQSKK